MERIFCIVNLGGHLHELASQLIMVRLTLERQASLMIWDPIYKRVKPGF